MTDTQFRLGQILPEDDTTRDAVHIAVVAMTASKRLLPGDRVVLNPDGRARYTFLDDWIGVVDPFLVEEVSENQRFWLFLKPNTITNLHHRWEHFAFDPPTKASSEKAEAVAWVDEFARRKYGYSGEDFIARLLDEDNSPFGDQDISEWDEQDKTSADEIGRFWECVRIITGKRSEHEGILPRQCCV